MLFRAVTVGPRPYGSMGPNPCSSRGCLRGCLCGATLGLLPTFLPIASDLLPTGGGAANAARVGAPQANTAPRDKQCNDRAARADKWRTHH